MSHLDLQWQDLPVSDLTGEWAKSWDILNAERGDLPFLATYFIKTALDQFGSGQERLLIAQDQQGPAVMLVLYRKHFFIWETFQPSQLPLGAWVARKDISLLEAACSVLHSGLLKFGLIIGITQVDPLLAPHEPETANSVSNDHINIGWVELEGSFSDYWNSRGKNLRQNLRRQRKKLVSEGVITTFRCLTETLDMANAVDRYGCLESAGWKSQQDTAIHRDNAQGHFYTKILEEACKKGEGVVFEYFFNDRLVASNLCLQKGRVLIRLKTTYDEKAKPYTPAFLLQEDQLEQSFQDGHIERMEFFGKIMEWHTRWTEKSRTLYHLTVFRYRWLKKIRHFSQLFIHFIHSK